MEEMKVTDLETLKIRQGGGVKMIYENRDGNFKVEIMPAFISEYGDGI